MVESGFPVTGLLRFRPTFSEPRQSLGASLAGEPNPLFRLQASSCKFRCQWLALIQDKGMILSERKSTEFEYTIMKRWAHACRPALQDIMNGPCTSGRARSLTGQVTRIRLCPRF